ncbi:MAG TPA: histidine phosphotransferase family protein [Aliidongia sp.]|uniref:histidine phosphotransferase family protein n=1 Tax=Aliidongia sp. TaxID=1914230 RepID=UPI002DDD1EC4|nr:histidine phosphotransferase family protein [Aliidongia sp.]HEV2673411.1 histidine phosphotransferase family protein [Aliidongia sp.]
MNDAGTDLRITELLAARLCHEMVSPIGAINNGVELLEDDPEFATDAAALIGQSSIQATRRLQFYRIAYGSTTEIAAQLARKATLDLFADGKITCVWPEALVPSAGGKLACNILLVAAEALPRGGSLTLATGPAGLEVLAVGEGARLPGHLPDALLGALTGEAIDARSVQAAFTGALARRAGLLPSIETAASGGVVFRLASAG